MLWGKHEGHHFRGEVDLRGRTEAPWRWLGPLTSPVSPAIPTAALMAVTLLSQQSLSCHLDGSLSSPPGSDMASLPQPHQPPSQGHRMTPGLGNNKEGHRDGFRANGVLLGVLVGGLMTPCLFYKATGQS